MNNFNCHECYDEGVLFWGNNHGEFDSEFCECNKGVSLYNEYAEWYASSELNEYTLENA
jgi:hypothetical protein